MNCHYLTDSEELEVEKIALGAAIEKLSGLNSDTDSHEIKRLVLLAFVNVQETLRSVAESLKVIHGKPVSMLGIDVPHIVATAFWMISEDVDSSIEVSPCSEAGRKLICFSSVIGAMSAMSVAQNLLSFDDDQIYGDCLGNNLLEIM